MRLVLNDATGLLPGADLLLPNVYDELMGDVVDVKDLGSGIIGGTECDDLALRTKEVDWQIWIAQGEQPYPCSYIITASQVDQGPQYSIQISDWKAGSESTYGSISASRNPLTPSRSTIQRKLDEYRELPDHLAVEGTK